MSREPIGEGSVVAKRTYLGTKRSPSVDHRIAEDSEAVAIFGVEEWDEFAYSLDLVMRGNNLSIRVSSDIYSDVSLGDSVELVWTGS